MQEGLLQTDFKAVINIKRRLVKSQLEDLFTAYNIFYSSFLTMLTRQFCK